jgi:hypothetical protein
MSRAASLLGLATLAAVASGTTASAVVVEFSVSSDSKAVDLGNGLDADVALDSESGSVDLTPGVEETVFLSGGEVGLLQGANGSGSGTLSRTLTIASPAATPTSRTWEQGVTVSTTVGSPPFEPASADVFVSGGSAVTFDLGGAYELTVTPLGTSRVGQTSTTIPFSTNATFLLTAVPEPTSGLAAVAAAGLVLARRRRSARA